MTLNVRISGPLSAHVADAVGEDGLFENVSEYVRHLIRKDREATEAERFALLKAELQQAFAIPQDQYRESSRESIMARFK
ncbi:ribbon-helix-helix domain-containing protein [Sandaracinobacteroides saxicola]|nr:addiction module antitoxin [Sandaracinobacteroides saxicola]